MAHPDLTQLQSPTLDLDALQREIAEDTRIDADPAKEQVERNPKLAPEYSFHFEHRTHAGKTYEGQFTNRILTIGERQQVGSLRSRLAGGAPYGSLDRLTAELNLIVSHCQYSLIEKPEWAKNLLTILDPGVIQALYEEVASHEATFLGWGAPPAGGEEDGGE